MNLWNDLVVRNPMNVEIRRAIRRSTRVSGASSQNAAAIVLALISYGGLLLITYNVAGSSNGRWVVTLGFLLAPIVATLGLHASIAGERERRTWDMLMVAPVTHAQVVVAKFLAGLAIQAALAAFLFVPAVVLTFTYDGHSGDRLSFLGVVWLFVVQIVFGAFCAALTMLVSARVKRSFMALGVALGTLLIVYAFFPAIAATGGSAGDILLMAHPATPLFRLQMEMYSSYPGERFYLDFGSSGLPCFLFHAAFAAVFLVWTIRTVSFADNEVKFLPRGKRDSDPSPAAPPQS